MSSSSASATLHCHTSDIADLAELLGASLLANIKDTLREAVALEAQLWRADALSILSGIRSAVRYRSVDTDFDDTVSSVSLATPGAPMPAIPSEQSSNIKASHRQTWRRTTSLEQRFAADVFAAKFGASTSKEIKVRNHTIDGSSSSGKSKLASQRLEPLVPSESANSLTLPSQLEVNDGQEIRASHMHKTPRSSRDCSFPGRSHGDTPLTNSALTSFVRSTSLGSSVQSATSSVGRGATSPGRDPQARDSDEQNFGQNQSQTSGASIQYQVNSSRDRSTTRWKDESVKFFYSRSTSFGERQGVNSIMSTMFCAIGVLPWSPQRLWLSRLYQFACLCCLVMSTLGIVILGNDSFDDYVVDIVAVATLLSFLASLWKREALRDTSWLIESYLLRAGNLSEVNRKSYLDILIMLCVWSVALGSRIYGNGMELTLGDVCLALNMLALLALCFCVSRMCRCLLYMVELFCCYMQDNCDFEKMLQEFFLLHCTIRTVCASFQLSFAILQLTATVLFLFCSTSIYMQRMNLQDVAVQVIPGVLCIMVLLQLAIRAGMVTDQCARVPMLVNSFNAKLDVRRMCVVDYIVYSQVGFYLFEVRLDTATVLKLSYIAFVAWCGVLTQGMI